MAEQYERLPEWFWHPKRGLYGHEEPARPGDRLLYVRVDDGAAAGSPPPTPAPTREQIRDAIADTWTDWDEFDPDTMADAVMALLSEPAPPLWTGETLHIWAATNLPDQSHIPNLPVPPGTVVEVREKPC